VSITTDRGLMIDMVDHAPDYPGDTAGALLEQIFAAAQPGAVFGTPFTSGAFTVITAGEVNAGGGFGSSRGTPLNLVGKKAATGSPTGETGGMGGGGGASGRPIAAIVIGPDGVTVKPVLDLTKIVLAGIAALGAISAIVLKLRSGAR
jgi:uncharacterized spore protein YtfJ